MENVREAHANAYACLDHDKCSIQDCCFSPDGIHFATTNGDLNIWSLELARHDDSKKRSGALVHKHSGMTCVRYAGGGRYVVAGKDDNLFLIEVPQTIHGPWVPVRRFRLTHPLSKGGQPGKSIIFAPTRAVSERKVRVRVRRGRPTRTRKRDRRHPARRTRTRTNSNSKKLET